MVSSLNALTAADPKTIGMSADGLRQIDAMIQSCIAEEQIAGAVVAIARQGKVAYVQPFGWSDRENRVPMALDTLFRMASMTKPVTSVAAMMLCDIGRLSLDDPISRYLPEFEDTQVLAPDRPPSETPIRTVPAVRSITVRHLLTHTSGLSYRLWGLEPLARQYREAGLFDGISIIEGTIGQMVEKLAKLPLLFQPGDAWHYGLNTDVLGRLVEVVSGLTLDRFLRERIFQPLKMADTGFYPPSGALHRLATVYTPNPQGALEPLRDGQIVDGSFVFDVSYPYAGPKTYYSGGGGLVSTTGDYLRFCQMLLNVGELDGARLLSANAIELMTQNQIGDLPYGDPAGGHRFGLGFDIHADPSKSGEVGSAGEYAWGGAWGTRFWIDPKERLIGLLFVQRNVGAALDVLEKLRALTYAALS